MMDDFYRSFEEKHRGSRDLIKPRFEIYLPFILPLKQTDGLPLAIDLGCGRGEWLELLIENGFDPRGVDLDDGMLEACRDLNLKVEKKDALSALASLSDESMGVVSGFHIAEHLPFDVLRELVKEALRVLKPGGILILETPNPENVVVGTSAFYLDPTHVKPVPQELLAFIAEYSGFHRIKIVRLQENKELMASSEPNLLDVLYGVSPDYAVVAQKIVDTETLSCFDAPFSEEYGLSLEELSARFDQRIALMRAQLAQAVQALEEARQARIFSQELQRGYDALLHSRSWRLTAPLRSFGMILRSIKNFLIR